MNIPHSSGVGTNIVLPCLLAEPCLNIKAENRNINFLGFLKKSPQISTLILSSQSSALEEFPASFRRRQNIPHFFHLNSLAQIRIFGGNFSLFPHFFLAFSPLFSPFCTFFRPKSSLKICFWCRFWKFKIALGVHFWTKILGANLISDPAPKSRSCPKRSPFLVSTATPRLRSSR